MARISVIIPTKNAGQEFEDTLISIQSQDVDDIELIVIDSGSTDGTVELAEQYADTIIEIPPDEFHHGQTRNQAADQAEGDIIVFTVQDAVPIDDEWLSQLTSPINDGNADVCYGNQIAYPDAKPSDKFFYKYFYPDTSITLTKSDASKKGEFYMDNIFLSDATQQFLATFGINSSSSILSLWTIYFYLMQLSSFSPRLESIPVPRFCPYV
ncbi:glycosyltransferase family A protein [Haloferax sp. ATB1]|uniref:glycosyltransferase family 2 protein n=1 Tax=Haloferax sp. ATB1 TaxID=1508454 RepID=UPI0009E4E022|nr:glycosyltransferase family A protein [Haloferax sp. ATB1]